MPQALTKALTKVSRCSLNLWESTRELERERSISRMEKEVAKWFEWQGRLLLESLPQMANFFPVAEISEALREALVDDFDVLFDKAIQVTIPKGETLFADGLVEGMRQGYEGTLSEKDMMRAFSLDDPLATDWAKRNAAIDVTNVNNTTKETMRDLVQKGISEGKDYDTVARQISARFKEFAVGKPQEHIQSRAHLVAINENAVAYESGGRMVVNEIQDAGIDMEKMWGGPGAEDSHTSQGCLDNISQGWIPADQEFQSGHQHPPRFPGCRHHAKYRVSREGEE